MRSSAQVKEAANAQIPVADYVPFGSHITPTVIKNKRTGDYITTWRLEGISFETADLTQIATYKETLCNFLRALGGGNWAVWSHKVRRVVRERLDGSYENDFCAELTNRYNQRLDEQRQMATELYLTVVYRPSPSKVVRLFKRMKRSVEDIKARMAEDLDVLDDMAKTVEASLRKFGPERLSTFTRKGVVYSEMLGFLGLLVNGVWEDTPLRKAEIAEFLPSSRLLFGDKNGMLQVWHPKGEKFVGFLDFQEYPQWSEPGMNDPILYGDYEFIETQSFSILNRRDAMDALEKQEGQLLASEDASPTEIEQMKVAKDMLQGGHIEMGEYHYSLAVFGRSLNEVAKNMADARTALADGPGFKMATIDAIPECAWFAQCPGNWSMRPREAQITSRNFANLSPLHNFARGKREGNPWGEALTMFQTPSGQPFYFNFHVSPEDTDSTDEKYPGNTFICGTTGVGKTALEMALLAFATKYQGLRAVCFDKDRGMEIGIRMMGGRYLALKRGEPTGFNPFQRAPTKANVEFCVKLVKLLVKPATGDFTAREEQQIDDAVRTVMSDKVSFEVRGVTTVMQGLSVAGENSLKERLKKWTRSGPLGWVFDNPSDRIDFAGASLFGFDYTEFLDDPEVRTPIMAYLLHVTESLIDGRPFMYFMEEFWKPLMDEIFSDFALNKQKTIRKESGLGVFVTQSPSDVLVHRIGKTMVEQSVTQIFLPNPRADHADYVQGFKVTEAEFRIIKGLGEQSRMFLVKQGDRSAVVKFDLGGMTDILNVISGSKDNVELLDRVRAEVGDDPKVWAPVFHQRIAERKSLIRKGAEA
jgi:type IV secretion system protein VirB4